MNTWQETTVTPVHIVQPLTSADTGLFLEMCEREPLLYMTPRLNIETFGFDGPILRAWGAICPKTREMRGLLFRLNNTMIAADPDGSCSAAFVNVIDREKGIAGVRGTASLVSAIQMGLRSYRSVEWEDSYFLRLDAAPNCSPEQLGRARVASMDDLDLLADLYREAGTMYRSRTNVADKLATTRVVVVEEPALGRRPKRIASCGLLSPEGSDAGLIGGVYTMPGARGKGYAAACVSALAIELQAKGKLPVLFYENPVAGRVYRKLGFEECGRWAVLYLKSNSESQV